MESNGHKEARAWIADSANAAMFLTRAPVPGSLADPGRSLARAARAFPLAGLAIGAVTAALLALLTWAGFTPVAAAVIAMALSLLLTGALHEDGLADTADGFGGGRTRERKLEIMRDSRIGSYGVIALVLALLLKVQLLAVATAPAVIFAAMVSRASMAWLLYAAPGARADGLAAAAGRPTGREIIETGIVTALGAVLVLILSWSAQAILLALIFAAIAALLMRWLCLRQIGGQTGDVCGAAQVLTELAALAAWGLAG